MSTESRGLACSVIEKIIKEMRSGNTIVTQVKSDPIKDISDPDSSLIQLAQVLTVMRHKMDGAGDKGYTFADADRKYESLKATIDNLNFGLPPLDSDFGLRKDSANAN